MAAILSFATLLITTLLATGAAVVLVWLLLRVAFHWMQPAAKRAVVWSGKPELVRGSRQLIRAYETQR